VFSIRTGLNLGNKTYFLRNTGESDRAEVLSAFIPQYYLTGEGNGRTIPRQLLVNDELHDSEVIEDVLSEQAGAKVSIQSRVRGDRARWLEMAENNVGHALASHLASRASLMNRFEALQDALGLEELPERLECFDISHTMGEATVASCVVFDTNGAVKSDYRRFNIENITPGDDYAAMHQALARRYRRLKEGEGKYPDILLIDGGRGQVAQAAEVLEELQVSGVLIVGVAKGPTRKPGLEQLVLSDQKTPIILPADSPALHLIQQVRDEAHRFAITGHRARRGKARKTSSLEGIPGLGPKRRQLLLRQFGGMQELSRAGVEELASVSGISKALAQKIYDTFHSDEG
jgi:excinuclease ABC subunit C